MKSNRRSFLKLSGLAGLGLAGSKVLPAYSANYNSTAKLALADVLQQADSKHKQYFNMSGYAAPKLDKVRIGFIGLGNRGPAAVKRMSKIEGAEIKGLCDLRPEKVNAVKAGLGNSHSPLIFTGNADIWKQMCEREDIDLIYIATPWQFHTPMAVYAMKHGKHVCVEVPAALTLDECWQLVETSERTKKHCKILENCCYAFFELLTLTMARQGFFGEIIHCEGAYIHDLLQGNFAKNKYWDMWRLKQNTKRNGNLYPTHGLGPVSQIMNLNRGDSMSYLSALSSNDFMMKDTAIKLAQKDDFYQPYTTANFRGNINTSIIRTEKGRSIMIQHDVTSPRPYSRIHLISGTKATAQKYPLEEKIAIAHAWENADDWNKMPAHEWLSAEAYHNLAKNYTPPIVKKIGEMAKEVGGHGGMDFLMDWTTIDCLRNGLPMDIDVYDTALWSSILPLSEWSVANRSNSITVPDFTCGAWKNNRPVDISLANRGNTKVRL